MKACLISHILTLSLGTLLFSTGASGKAACESDKDCEKSCHNLINAVYGVGEVKSFASYAATHGKCATPQGSSRVSSPSKCECYNKNEDKLAWFTGDFNVQTKKPFPACSADADCATRCQLLVVGHNATVKGSAAASGKCVSPRCVCYNYNGSEVAYFEAS